jgi:hypothetical protein
VQGFVTCSNQGRCEKEIDTDPSEKVAIWSLALHGRLRHGHLQRATSLRRLKERQFGTAVWQLLMPNVVGRKDSRARPAPELDLASIGKRSDISWGNAPRTDARASSHSPPSTAPNQARLISGVHERSIRLLTCATPKRLCCTPQTTDTADRPSSHTSRRRAHAPPSLPRQPSRRLNARNSATDSVTGRHMRLSARARASQSKLPLSQHDR